MSLHEIHVLSHAEHMPRITNYSHHLKGSPITSHADSLQNRRKRKRAGTLSIKQIEVAHIVSSAKLNLPEMKWQHFPGTNTSDCLTGVVMPRPDGSGMWQLSWKDKKSLLGKRQIIAVGGKTDGINKNDSEAVQKRTDTSIEPVCYNPMPANFYDDILKGFFVKAVIDLSPLSDTFAWTCILNRKAYIGITYTEDHSRMLEERLLDKLKTDMACSSCPLFNPAYAIAIGAQKDPVSTKTPKPKRKADKLAAAGAADGDGEQQKKAEAKAQRSKKKLKVEPKDAGAEGGEGADSEDSPWDPMAGADNTDDD